MTVTATSAKFPFSGNGVTTAFPFTGRIFQASDIQLYIDGILQVVGYSVAFALTPPYGGTVTITVPPANGIAVWVVRNTPRTQNTDWIENSGDPAQAKEDAADRLTNIEQEQDEVLARTPSYSLLNPAIVTPGIATPVVGQFLRHKDTLGNVDSAVPALGTALSNPVSFAQGGTSSNYGSALALAQGLNIGLWKQGADIASAATINLPNPLDGNLIKITGAVGIGGISATGVNIGTRLRLWFTGAPLLTNGAQFKLLRGANYQTQVDDKLSFIYLGGNIWQEEDSRIAGAVGAFQAQALSRVWGLVGNNNVGTPNSQFDLSAQGIVFFDPTSGMLMSKYNQGVLTNNVLTAGPAANGRDQGAVFGINVWVHFYFIVKLDGTVATLSSISPPPGGPTLPAGYVAWAYCGAVRYTAAPILIATIFRGARAYIITGVLTALNAGNAAAATQIILTSQVPPNALASIIAVTTVANYSAVVGSISAFFGIDNTVTTGTVWFGRCDSSCQVLNQPGFGNDTFEIPGLTLWYIVANTGTTPIGSHGVYAFVAGYKMPNGGE